jgi:hypothetical protein
MSQFVGAFGVISAFAMAREISKNPKFPLCVALLFALMPKFVTNTLWEVPARGVLMSVTPVFIWAVVRSIRSRSLIDVSLIAVSATIMLLSHRLALLVFIVLLAFVVSLIFVVSLKIVRLRFPAIFLSLSFRRITRVMVLPVYGVLLVISLFGSGVLEAYRQGAIFSSRNAFGEVGNLVVSISRSVGLLSPIAFLGIAVAARKRNKSDADYLFLAAPIALIPTLFLRDYTGYYLVTFFALFIGMGVTALLVRVRGSLQHVVSVAFCALVVLSAVSAINTELPRQSFMTNSEYSVGLYARYQVFGTIASNDGLLGVRIASVTGRPLLPVGGATTAAWGPDALAFGFVKDFRVVPVSFWQLTPDSDSMFVPLDVTAGADWSTMMSSHLGAQSSTFAERYNVGSVLENSDQQGVYYTGWGVVYDSPLLRDVYNARYLTFEGDGVRIWAAF